MWKKELGIDVTLAPLEQKTWLANQLAQSYQISSSRWIGDYLDANTFLDLWMSDNGKNQTGWKNSEYDRLISTAARTLDTATRQGLQQKAEAILLDDAPVVPIFYGTRVYLLHPAVKNWPPSLLGLRRYQLIELMEENKQK
jgi:oligopeptide transport system substrate-binding protein